MKIKYTNVEIGKGYTWLELWLMLPDFYTFWSRLGSGDREFLELCWKKKRFAEIEKFMEGYRLSLCRGSIRFGARGEMAHKKFSWTWFRNRIYGALTELNTPYPKSKSKTNPRIKPIRDVPISRVQYFITLLQLQIHIPPVSTLREYVTLYILIRDHGKNISSGSICR